MSASHAESPGFKSRCLQSRFRKIFCGFLLNRKQSHPTSGALYFNLKLIYFKLVSKAKNEQTSKHFVESVISPSVNQCMPSQFFLMLLSIEFATLIFGSRILKNPTSSSSFVLPFKKLIFRIQPFTPTSLHDATWFISFNCFPF